ncbi:MAG: PadR family transcriptional regulator [Candidatus Omnitrophica bacterium]|nr:PadR family transcriptional regulator [Candidatus Omnitrophota bacterium]
MIEHELLFLGLLKESPKHGYQIKKKIKEVLSIFAGVDLKSIYYPLKVLEEKGLVIKRMVKEGGRPIRFVYELTKEGEARFDKLLSESFLNFKRPQFSLDLSLYFLPYIEPEVARRKLRARVLILRRLSKELKKMLFVWQKRQTPLSLIRILDHNQKMVDAEVGFLKSLIESL